MLMILYGDLNGEMGLDGTVGSFVALGQLLRRGSGDMDLATADDPYPYVGSLSRITVRQSNRKIVMRVVDGKDFEVCGNMDSLRQLARNIENFAASAYGKDHLHVDYHPDHWYLEEESVSLVVRVDPALE
ncbi:hypothetical protein STSO111631_09405 [Stackebrandtia soli]